MFIASALASACVIHQDVRPAGGITMPTISECIPAMPWEHEARANAGATVSTSAKAMVSDLVLVVILSATLCTAWNHARLPVGNRGLHATRLFLPSSKWVWSGRVLFNQSRPAAANGLPVGFGADTAKRKRDSTTKASFSYENPCLTTPHSSA